MDTRETLEALEQSKQDYVWERSKTQNSTQACKAAHISRTTYYSWEDREELDELANKLRADRKLRAELILESVIDKAAQVKADGLDSHKENVRQASSTEILDRLMGKPTQNTRISGADGEPLTIEVRYTEPEN